MGLYPMKTHVFTQILSHHIDIFDFFVVDDGPDQS